MASIASKLHYLLFKVYLYVLSNIDDQLFMKHYIPFLKSIGVNINGTPRFISYDAYIDRTETSSLIELNDNCVISGHSMVLTHDYSIFHASIGCNKISKTDPEFKRTGTIIIGENAFVGANSIILPNVVVGKNAIVGAGSVVTKDVPENTIVAGNPARKIEMIQEYVDKTVLK